MKNICQNYNNSNIANLAIDAMNAGCFLAEDAAVCEVNEHVSSPQLSPLLRALANGKKTVESISAQTGLNTSTVRQTLGELTCSLTVDMYEDRNGRYYSLSPLAECFMNAS